MAVFSKVVASVCGNNEASKALLVESFGEAVAVFVKSNNRTGLNDAVLQCGKSKNGKVIFAAIGAAMENLKIGYIAPQGIKFDDQPEADRVFWLEKIEASTVIFSEGVAAIGAKRELSEADKTAKADKLAEKKASEFKTAFDAKVTELGLVPANSIRPFTASELVSAMVDALAADTVNDSEIETLQAAIKAARMAKAAEARKAAKAAEAAEAQKAAEAAHNVKMLTIEASGMGETAEAARDKLATLQAA